MKAQLSFCFLHVHAKESETDKIFEKESARERTFLPKGFALASRFCLNAYRLQKKTPFFYIALALCMICLFGVSCNLARIGSQKLIGRPNIPVRLTQARIRLIYNLRHGTFTLARLYNSIRLAQMETVVEIDGRAYSSGDESCVNTVEHSNGLVVTIQSAAEDGPTWETCFEIRIHPDEGNPTLDRLLHVSYGVEVRCRLLDAPPDLDGAKFLLKGVAETDQSAFACRLDSITSPVSLSNAEQFSGDRLNDATGNSFYDSEKKCAIYFHPANLTVGEPYTDIWKNKQFPIRMEFDSAVGIEFAEKIYRTSHEVEHLPVSPHNGNARPMRNLAK